MLPIFLAPLQGYTDFIYRNNHAKFAGGIAKYYSPFIRCEKGTAKERDLWDIRKENNQEIELVPQIIFSDIEEFNILVEAVTALGYKEIDLNMGCPYPMQTSRHRESGILPITNVVEKITTKINEIKSIQFSIKMRLGLESPQESAELLPILNSTRLSQITLHPRLGKQQYKGALDETGFQKFYEECKHPLVFNGDVLSIRRIRELEEKYPRLSAIMIGRGILTLPTLAAEYAKGVSYTEAERSKVIWQMHQGIYQQSKEALLDSNQMLNRLRCFWEYQTETLPSKLLKQIAKCRNLANYQSLIPEISSHFKEFLDL